MNCTPDKCPHRALMEQARAACLACDHVEPASRGGMVSADAAGERVVRREALDLDRGPRQQVTALPADQEELLAELFRRLVSMDTLDALLMLHVANGGTPKSFGPYLERVRAQIQAARPLRDNYRATAWAKFRALVRRFKPFIKGRLHAWDDGHGGAIRRERVAAEREAAQGDLFEGRA